MHRSLNCCYLGVYASSAECDRSAPGAASTDPPACSTIVTDGQARRDTGVPLFARTFMVASHNVCTVQADRWDAMTYIGREQEGTSWASSCTRQQPSEGNQELLGNAGEIKLVSRVVGSFCTSARLHPPCRRFVPRLCASSTMSARSLL